MKRRDFFKSTAALAASLGLPAGAIAAASSLTGASGVPIQDTPPVTEPIATEANPVEKATRLRIGNWRTAELREANRIAREAGEPELQPDPPDDEKNYWADAIQRGDEFFYRVGDTTVPISVHEYRWVIADPNTYYFSSALKLHVRIERTRSGELIPS